MWKHLDLISQIFLPWLLYVTIKTSIYLYNKKPETNKNLVGTLFLGVKLDTVTNEMVVDPEWEKIMYDSCNFLQILIASYIVIVFFLLMVEERPEKYNDKPKKEEKKDDSD